MLVKVCNQIVTPRGLTQSVTASTRKIVPVNSKDFRYLRFRAIGNMEQAGSNGNWDGFPYEHFEDDRAGYGYRSFINKRAHFEHNSKEGTAGSIGDLPDAFLNAYIYSETVSNQKWADLLDYKSTPTRFAILNMPNQRDGAIEVLMRIDTNLVKSARVNPKVKEQLERLVRMIDTGQKLTCSMGCNVGYSVCTACGNAARFSTEYCSHLKQGRKGGLTTVSMNDVRDMLTKGTLREEWLKHLIISANDIQDIVKSASNRGTIIRNAEINHELSFFELSVVGTPAYAEAYQLEKLARQQEETSQEYLKRIKAELGEDVILDLFSFLQNEGLVSQSCLVR